MGVLTIRNLDDDVKAKLRAEAGREGVSMEEQARRILTKALGAKDPNADVPFGQALARLFAGRAGDGLDLPPRRDPAAGASIDR